MLSIIGSLLSVVGKLAGFLLPYFAGKKAARADYAEESLKKSQEKMKYAWMSIVCLTLMSLSACSTSGAGIDICSIMEPILISKDDILTDETARQILVHNEFYSRVCQD